MQLSQKAKRFCRNFSAFLESTLNILKQKMSLNLSISEIIDSE